MTLPTKDPWCVTHQQNHPFRKELGCDGKARTNNTSESITADVRMLAEVFWQFHNDRLADPSINEMKPYLDKVLDWGKQQQKNILEQIGEPVLGDFDVTYKTYGDVLGCIKWYKNRIKELQDGR